MKMKVAAFAASVLSFIGALTTSGGAATVTPGTYNAVAYVSLQNGSPCVFSQGENLFYFITYSGPGVAAKAHFQNANTPVGPVSVILSLPKTPKTGTSWGGSYSGAVEPNKLGKWTSAFSGTLTATGTLSFVGTMTFQDWPYPTGGTCTVTMNYSAVFVGPVN